MIQALTLILCGASAEYRPVDIVAESSLSLESSIAMTTAQPEEMEALPPTWGKEGTSRWGFSGGFAKDLKESKNTLGLLGVEYEYFVNDNLSLDLGLFFMDIDQVDTNVSGLNFTLQLRWHFITKESWSMFIEGGAGLLRTSKDAPSSGSAFNFTPQAGVGFSFDIGNNNRWLIGTKWFHISNANTYSSNPGRDSLMIWTGISFPF
jgi:lipid A 3-O-deacylase